MKSNQILKVLFAFMSGIVLGFLLSPIKKGINVEIKNNGNEHSCDEIFKIKKSLCHA